MRYLVQMKLANNVRPASPQEGIRFIEGFILPTLEACKRLEDEKRILAGGPVSGSIAIAIVVSVESVQDLDELLEGLPLWPLMETTVTPLTSFDGRRSAVRSTLDHLKERSANETAGAK